jgi:hypothetical protein
MTYVDHAALDRIASSFTVAADELDNIATTTPSLDGGRVTVLLLDVIAKFCTDAGSLSGGLKSSSSAVTKANNEYRRTDASVADGYVNAWKEK